MTVNKNNDLTNITVSKFNSAYRQIAEQLREEIGVGHFLPGVRLPTSRELAATWNVSTFTVHKALALLVESGVLVRLRAAGTFVAEFKPELKSVALYYGRNFLACGVATDVYRHLHQCLTQKLAEKKLESRFFIDAREPADRVELMDDLKRAVERREVQAVIAPMMTNEDIFLLQKAPVPCAFVTNRKTPNNIFYNFRQLLAAGLDQLIAQGCRDIALISNTQTEDENAEHEPFVKYFLELAQERGLTPLNQWIRTPQKLVPDQNAEAFGKNEFRKLWAQKRRPQGLIVYPDSVVRGVVAALKESHVSVPDDLKLAFHRNEGVPLICPFPATWMTTDIDAVAEALIDQIERQMRGERVEAILLPFLISQEEGQNI